MLGVAILTLGLATAGSSGAHPDHGGAREDFRAKGSPEVPTSSTTATKATCPPCRGT